MFVIVKTVYFLVFPNRLVIPKPDLVVSDNCLLAILLSLVVDGNFKFVCIDVNISFDFVIDYNVVDCNLLSRSHLFFRS